MGRRRVKGPRAPRLPDPAPAAALLVFALAGCYAYAPAEPGAAGPGAEVRAVLSPEGSRRLGRPDLLGAGNTLTGVVERVTDDSLVLSVRRPELRGVERFGSRRDTVVVGLRELEGLERRRLRPVQTGAVAAAAGGGMVVVFGALLDGEGGGGGSDGGREPRLLLRVPLNR